MATKTPSNPNKDFDLIKSIRENELYKRPGRDEKARKWIEENIDLAKKGQIFPGQMVMFNYFNPKTKEELEFYDASPCTLFFGIFNSSLGRRVLGFNVHYLPPALRYRVADRIFKIYRPVYLKYFNEGLSHEIDGFEYRYIMDELAKVKLDWTVRMYDPALIGAVRTISPEHWSTALLTEGHFKKDTKAHIMQLFKQASIKEGKHHTVRGAKYNRKR